MERASNVYNLWYDSYRSLLLFKLWKWFIFEKGAPLTFGLNLMSLLLSCGTVEKVELTCKSHACRCIQADCEFLCSNLRLRERVQLSQHIEIGSEVGYECVLAWPCPLRTANQNLWTVKAMDRMSMCFWTEFKISRL